MVSRYHQFRSKRAWALWIGVLFYIVIFFIFYPRITAIVDENAYLTQAFLFKSGKLVYDQGNIPAPILTFDMRDVGGHIVSKYPIGNSLWLVPFLSAGLGWRAVFLSGLLCAVIGTWLIALILRSIDPGIDPVWALLFLFYPTVVVFSRTIMSDLPATILVLGSFYFLRRGSNWVFLSGFLLGMGALFRYPMLVLVIPFLVLLFLHKRQFKGVFLFLLGLLPLILLILIYNRYAFGSFLRVPMWRTDRFGIEYLPHHLLFYSIPLVLWYPLMLFSPFLATKGHRPTLFLPPLTLLLFYATFSFTPSVKNLFEQVVIGLRYLLPALPFFIIGFALGLEQIIKNIRINPSGLKLGLIIPALIAVVLQFHHHRYLKNQEFYAKTLLAVVPPDGMVAGNKDVIELLNVAWGWRDWLPIDSLNNCRLLTDRPVYLAVLEKSARTETATLSKFAALVEKFPDRVLVTDINKPHLFQIFRLR